MFDNPNRSLWQSIEEAFLRAREIILSPKIKTHYGEAKKAIEYCASEDPIAQYQLYGLKWNDEDPAYRQDAVLWCQKSAESGYAPAQYDLGLHYLYGDDVPCDIYQSIQWLERSAGNGYPEAARKLVTLYVAGTKVRRNLPRASYWKEVYEDISYLEDHQLLPIRPDMLQPLPREEKKHLYTKPFDDWQTYAELFQPIQQQDVIEADASRSFVIDAGPGTGKTYTLIQRINHLVHSQNIQAEDVVVMSFTNAVVDEVKSRLSNVAQTAEGDRSIRNTTVKTFHSFAYWLLKNANEQGWEDWQPHNLNFDKLTYDDCMVLGADLMDLHPEISSDWKYLIVDEIQDINHGKARFCLSVLKSCITNQVPFMFLGDSCQAIYNYLDKNTLGEEISSDDFYHRLVDLTRGIAEFKCFEHNYRSNQDILQQTLPIRELILQNDTALFGSGLQTYTDSCRSVSLNAIRSMCDHYPEQTICLMARSNIAAQQISRTLIKAGISHRNILSTSKNRYPQWIGQIFGGLTDQHIYRDSFVQRCLSAGLTAETADEAWTKLQENESYASEIINMDDFRIGLRSHSIDWLFPSKEDKHQLIVSNIHRSKGLEYDRVCLDGTFLDNNKIDIDEMRTLYVAITRAKLCNYVLRSTPDLKGLKYDKYGRARIIRTENKIKVLQAIELMESGSKSDIGPNNFILEDMHHSQQLIQELNCNDPIELTYETSTECYAIRAKGSIIGWMNESFNRAVQYNNEKGLPPCFKDLYIDGVFTHIEEPTTYDRHPHMDPAYKTSGIWNYITVSGLARAVYVDTKNKTIHISQGKSSKKNTPKKNEVAQNTFHAESEPKRKLRKK